MKKKKKKTRLRVHFDKLKKYIICNYKVVAQNSLWTMQFRMSVNPLWHTTYFALRHHALLFSEQGPLTFAVRRGSFWAGTFQTE